MRQLTETSWSFPENTRILVLLAVSYHAPVNRAGRAETTKEEASRMAELVAVQGAGALVRRLVEAADSAEAPPELREATLYDCAVVVFNLAGAAAACAALQRDLVGERGVLPALAIIAEVR